MKTFEFGEVIRLKPGEKAVVEGMTIENGGLGHKMTEGKGDLAFVVLKIQYCGETSSLNFFTTDLPRYQQWNDWLMTLNGCDDTACEWIVTEKKFCSGSL
jgi:hypothetical protein